LTAQDIYSAIQGQNVQVAAGQIGQPPASGQAFQYTVTTLGRLNTEEQFRNIIIKTGAGESVRITRLGEVARIELVAKSYDQYFPSDGQLYPGLAVLQFTGA